MIDNLQPNHLANQLGQENLNKYASLVTKDQMVTKPYTSESSNDVEMAPAAVVVDHPSDMNLIAVEEHQLNGSPPVADFLFLVSSIEDFYSYYSKAYFCNIITSINKVKKTGTITFFKNIKQFQMSDPRLFLIFVVHSCQSTAITALKVPKKRRTKEIWSICSHQPLFHMAIRITSHADRRQNYVLH